jgi:heat-inducible transcriptional repressor
MEEQLMISHLFHQVERDLEQWTDLAAALLARIVQSMAIVTSAKAVESRLKHLELVAVHDFLTLLIILLHETELKKQLLAFDEAISQEGLTFVSNRLNAAFRGLTRSEILTHGLELSPVEEQVTKSLVHTMEQKDDQRYEEPRIKGLRHMLLQPEFASRGRMLGFIEVMESGRLTRSVLPHTLAEGGVQVIIGAENREDAMRDCSIVVTQYGVPGEVSGALGVLGPTRMQYGRAIATVRYMGSLMSGLVAELHSS